MTATEVQEKVDEPKVRPIKIDLTPNENDGEILTFYKQTMSQIEAIDEKLDAGLDSTGKRKLTNECVEATEEKWGKVFNELSPQMEAMPPEMLAGVYYGLVRAFTDKFKESIDEWLQAQIDAQPKVEDTTSEEEKKELAEARSELAASAKQIVAMATNFGLCSELEPWALPRRRGAVGKRGKRALTLYTWSIDGDELAADSQNVKSVALALGFTKAGDFTKALRAEPNPIDTKTPPVQFEKELNGKTVSAVRSEPLPEDEVSTEPDDEDDSDEDEDEE